MNETLKTIMNRRSIRSYTEKQVENEDLKQIIDAGLYAPSAMNQQSWHFTVIQNKDIINKMNEICKVIIQQTSKPDLNLFYNAPTVILVSGEEKAIAPENDCSLAMENMFIAAASLGIGSCWVHSVRRLSSTPEGQKLLKEIGIPAGYSIVGSGIFGYPASGSPTPSQRKDSTVNIIK